ncbi:MAG: triose-phosphate isomerase [Bacillota bacterium]
MMHTRRRLIAGNWKMHMVRAEADGLVRAILDGLGGPPPARALAGTEVAVFPPFTALAAVAPLLAGRVSLGAQNVHWAQTGAFTGEVSPGMLLDLCCKYALTGHSERRHVFGESDAMVARRFAGAAGAGLVPVLCVGETLGQREAGQTQAVVAEQLTHALDALDALEAQAEFVVAYEPVWAIGTGKAAGPEDAEAVCAFIRAVLAGHSSGQAAATRILYGGSVKPDNAGAFFRQPNIDGALVGGASLGAGDFLAIVRAQ